MVALLAEGVDRNDRELMRQLATIVALLAEGVDRNMRCVNTITPSMCRPPRGGRG